MAHDLPRLETVFAQAIEIESPAECAAFVERACCNNPELRRDVDQLVSDHFRAGKFLESPVAHMVATVDDPIQERPGTVIGPYKLLEQIGEGGFGLVFLAEQQQPVRRKVAVKVLKPGMDTRQVIARFEAERQALALMDHPNIARVLDAGETASGRPHFVMELVKGVAITDYCDQHRLTTRERLELFVHVCQAVQHAHHKGIIHRDIKPSNVLVTVHDDVPVVKVIDFGIAKALGQQLTEKTVYTGAAQMIGTPMYMSPEQAGMSGLDIDTRSDVYSLGVLLYELLTGTTPFDKERLRAAGYDEMRRIIREEEPPSPSTRLSTQGQAAATVSERRRSDPKRLGQLLRGELDWIVMKALEKDRTRRYETANGFAQDLKRYLADEPVLACPPSAWYRCRKFARRNKPVLVVAACVLLVVACLAGSAGWITRDRAARRAQSIGRLQNNLTAARTYLADNKPDLVRRKLAEARAEIGTDRAGLATLAVQLDAVELELDRWQRFFRLLDGADEAKIVVRHWQPAQAVPIVLDEPSGPANPQDRVWQPGQAVPFVLDALTQYEVLQREDWRARLEQGLLGNDQKQEIRRIVYEQLVWLADDVLRRAQEHGTEAKLSPQAAAEAAGAYLQKAETARAPTAAFYRLRAQARRTLGQQITADLKLAQQTPPTMASDFYLQGQAAYARNDRDKGIQAFEAALRLEPRHYRSLEMLGCCLSMLGRRPEDFSAAAMVFTGCIMMRPDYAPVYYYRGIARDRLEQWDKALADYSKAIELNPKNAIWWRTRGIVYVRMKQSDKAFADYSKAIELDPKNAYYRKVRGFAYAHLGQWDKALADYSKATELDPENPQGWAGRGAACAGLKQWDKALAAYSKAIELHTKAIEAPPKNARAWINRGHVYAIVGQWDKAAADLVQAVQLDPDNDAWWWEELAAYHLQAGDSAAYRTACKQMLERFSRTKNPIIAHRVALSCLLIPQADKDEKLVQQLAQQSAAGRPHDVWCLITLGAALYRAGQFEAAVRQLELTRKRWPEDPYKGAGPGGGPVLSWLVLAMAHHRLGHADQARRWLDKAAQTMDKESAATVIGPLRQESHVWAMCLVLRHEAELLEPAVALPLGKKLPPAEAAQLPKTDSFQVTAVSLKVDVVMPSGTALGRLVFRGKITTDGPGAVR